MPRRLTHILRLSAPALAGIALCCGAVSVLSAESSSAGRGVVAMLTDGDGGSIALVQDLAGAVDDGSTRRLLPVAGHGGLRDLIDLKSLRDLDAAIVTTDALQIAKKPNAQPEVDKVSYVAKLYNEELHILARSHIRSIEELAGRRVNFDGAAVLTGPAVFSLLKIEIEPTFDPPGAAMARLNAGDIAAIAYVAAKPAPRFALMNEPNGLHFLAIPFTPVLAKDYVPATLTPADYPRLVHADTPTIAVGAVMVVANLPRDSERYHNVANFVDAFFTQLPLLKQDDHDPKWASVNISAELPGWTRFPPAEAWLRRHPGATPRNEDRLMESFTRFLDERSKLSGGPALSAQEKQQLFDQFRHWKSAQTQ